MNLDAAEVLARQFAEILPKVGAGLLVIIAFLLVARAVRATFGRVARRVGSDQIDMVNLAGITAFYALITFGVISGLGTMGVDVGALVAGLGLAGFALGFALRDAVSNLLAGVLVLTYRPFRRGDHIIVDKYEGIVTGIDLRYTTLDGDGKRYLIPNQTLFTNPITVVRAEAAPQPPEGG